MVRSYLLSPLPEVYEPGWHVWHAWAPVLELYFLSAVVSARLALVPAFQPQLWQSSRSPGEYWPAGHLWSSVWLVPSHS